jgi:FSR family fosmidomycin resistance protein-like MFS transporter
MHRVDARAMATLSIGHLTVDLAQGAVPALLVFWKEKFDLSYAAAAAVVLCATIASSIMQPLFGLWSDRRGAMWLLPGGVALAGAGVAAASIAPSYGVILALVFVSGLGVAAYHPEGSKVAAWASGRKRASGMALFSIGGNFGIAFGPLLASTAVLAWGLQGGLVLLVPAALVVVLLLVESRHLKGFAPEGGMRRPDTGEADQPGAMALLLGVCALRSVAHFGLLTFVPLWEVAHGHGARHGSTLLSLILLSGAVGTLCAGPLADRLGRKPVLVGSLTLAAPLILTYVLVGGVVGEIAVILAGAAIVGTFGVTLVMSQEYMPRRVAMASGLSIGFSVGLGGIAAIALGAVADAIDLQTALLVVAVGPLGAVLLATALPPSGRLTRRARPATAPV